MKVRIAFLIILAINCQNFTFGQIVMKVVAADTVAETVIEPIFSDIQLFPRFSFISGGRLSKQPEKLLCESVILKVRKYSKLKTFEISFLDFNTLERSFSFYKGYKDLKQIKKQRWIYEGEDLAKHFELFSKISKASVYHKRKLKELKKRNGTRYYPKKKYTPTDTPLISDVYLEENKESDNFLLTIIYEGEKVTIPVGILMESTSAKRIQRTYSRFYDSYKKALEERREEWRELEEEFEDYFDNLETIPLNADFLTEEGDDITPEQIYIVDYTANVVRLFSQIENAFYAVNSDSVIVLFDTEGRMGYKKVGDLEKPESIGRRRQLVFDMSNSSALTFSELLEVGL